MMNIKIITHEQKMHTEIIGLLDMIINALKALGDLPLGEEFTDKTQHCSGLLNMYIGTITEDNSFGTANYLFLLKYILHVAMTKIQHHKQGCEFIQRWIREVEDDVVMGGSHE